MWSKLFGRHTDDSAKHNRRATRRLQLQGEPLEERRLLAIDVLGVPDWVDQGPRPILNGSATIPPNNPVTGAAQSIAVNPANSAQIYLGMVNGGIWRTNNANTANPSAMTWELLTPQAPSLAVGSIAFSPLDPAGNTLYAGTGTFSNLYNAGGAAVGILRSTDGGATWVNFGVNPADEPRIKTVLPTSIDLDPGAGVSQMVLVAGIDGSGGLYRSSNNGQSFTILSGSNGLPSGAVTQLIVDPNNAQRFFAAVPGIGGGVFRGDFNSVTGIISWTAVNTGIPTADIGTSANIQLTAEDFGATTVLFAGLADPPATGTIDAELTGVFRSVNGGGNWTALGTPASFNPWRAAGSGFSMVADPTDEDVVYIGGLQSPSEIFRYNPVGATWDLITGAGAQGGTAPHADTRDMVFLSDTVLLESDDGGLYFLPNPLDSTNNAWGSFIGETALGTALGGVEMHDIAWDSISNVIIGGSQDNGTEAQLTPNNLVWSRFQGGDGGDVAVDSLTLAGANRSIRYSSRDNLQDFQRVVFDAANSIVAGTTVQLIPAGGLAGFVGQFITPIALNAIAPPAGQSTRLVIGGGTDNVVTVGAVYEANNAGVAADAASVNWTQVPTGAGFASVSALVYGGRKGGASNPDVLYAGSDGKVFVRTTPGGMLNPTAGSFGAVRDIALDPNDWAHAFVVSDDEVWETIDAGANWANRTGNLGNGNLRTVEFVELGAVDVLLVGGAGGVFRSLSNNPGVWTELGAGMPNAVTYDLDYDASDDVLVAGTFGTGVWTVPAASTKIAQPGVMNIVGDTDFPGQDDVIRIVRNADNPSLLDVTLNGDLYLPRPQLSTLNQINVRGLSGNDTLIIDSSNGLVEVPGGIRFDGGTGFDLIRLEQTGGGQQDSDEYSVGALNNSGTSVITGPSGVQKLFFENVEPLVDLVPAVNLTVNGTPEANAINYRTGSAATNGLVTVDNYESIEFSNKDTLTINAGSGNDVVNLNNANVPTELTLIGVHGDDGDDEITTRSTAGVVLFAAGDAGNDTIDASGTASVVTLEGNDGDDVLQGGSAADTLTGGEGDDTFIASAGADTLTGGAGVNTLLVRGTAGDDEIELYQSAPGVIEVTAPVGSGSYSITDLALVQVQGLEGNDTIRVRGNASVDSANGVAMAIDAMAGNDTLIVDSSNGLVEVPGGIRFDGGTGFDLIRLEQTGGGQQDSDEYSVGALNNSGTSVITGPSGVQKLFFENVEPLVDLVPAVNLTVNGTPEANAINYRTGSAATNGLVTVDNYESIEFSNKDTLTINADSGNDVVNLNNANVPTELTLIAVHGDDGDDEITTRSTAGVVLFAAGDAGNDTIDASGTASVVTLEGNDGDDVLQGGSAADTLTGGAGDDTLIASAGDDTLTGGAGVNTLLVRGTAGDDEIELYQSAPGVIEVTAPVGSGSYSITDLALVQVQGLEGNDTIRVRGNASVDSANGVAMAIDAMSGNDTLIVDSSNGLVDVPGGIRFDGGTGFDLIRLEQSEGDQQDSHEYSVGAVNGSGTSVITGPSGVQQLFFENVEPLVDLVPAVNLTVNGTPEANAINYGVGPVATNGLVTVDNYESIEFSNKDTLTINAGSGNDVVNLNNLNVPAALTSISVFGDDGDDEITTRSTAGVVLFAAGGAGNDTIDASGTASVVTLEGNDGDDVLQGGSAADTLTGGAGDDTLIASAGDDTLTGGAGVNTLLVRGTVVSDTLSLFQSAAGTLDVTLSGSARSYTIDELDLIRVETLAGDDAIQVRASDTLVGADSLPMDIDGGGSNGRDLLVVNDEGLGNLVLYRKGADDTSGSVIVGELAPVSFQQIENVKFTPLNSITGGTGTDGQGRLVVFKHDPFENNDTMANATHLGGGATINVDPTIDPGGGPFDVPGDEDWYRFDAAENGVLDFQVFFTTLDVLPNGRPGLPQGGLLNVEIYDAQGNLIGSGQNFLNGGGTVIGKRIDVPVVRNQTYYMRILGAPAEEGPSEAINVYNFTVINTTLPVPFQVDLQAASDSGRHNDDDVTRIATSTFDAYLDDDRLLEFTNLGLVPDTIDNGVADGDFGVQFFNNGVLMGFATYQGPLPPPPPSPTVANNRWQFTIVGGGVGMQEGDNNFITAAVWVRDRANPTQFSRGDFSTPLQVTLDTIAPAQPTIVLDPSTTDSGVTGQQNTFADRITRFTAPGFTGSAEANAIVRLWADGPPISVGINASDVFEGLTVAVPLDGNLAFPNGQWQMTPRFDLNDPSVGFPLDGRRLMSATAEDLAGNESSRDNPATLDIFIDTAGPQLYTPPGASGAVHITGDPAFNLFDPKPAAGPTPRVDSITINIRDLPFRDALNFPIDPALVESVAATAGNYLLRGDHNGVIAIESVDVILDPIVTGQPATGRIILNFAEPLPDDRFTLTVSDNLVDPAGNHLDGESNAQQPVGIPSAISGDGQPGGAFVGRFTVDSRPEIGVYSDGSVYVDTNGNLVYDTTNSDFTNRDLVFKLGLATQIVFAGKFHPPGQAANGFDRLAVYGLVNGQWQFTFAGDDGTAKFTTSSLAVNGLPLAGNFDGNAANGDEVGVFDGKRWYLDTNGNNTIDNGDASFAGDMRGYPIAGDFDGDGLDDLATWTSGKYYFDLAANGGLDGDAEYSLDFGFSGVLERPVAGDLNLDGIDDLGLWTPGRSGQSNGSKAEWYFLLSEAPRDEERGVAGTIEAFDHPFSPQPVGNDLFATFGESFALPVFGNYDPPLTSAPPTGGNGGGGSTTNPPTSGPTVSLDSVQVTTGLNGAPQIKLNVKLSQAATTAVTVDYFTSDFNAQGGSITIPAGATTQSITIGGSSDLSSGKSVFATLDNARQAAIGTAQAVSQGVAAGVDAALDVNGDGKISSLDALVVINAINRAPANGGTPTSLSVSATKLDVNGDGRVSAIDALRVINHLNRESGTQTAAAAAAPIAAAGLPQPETVAAASPASDAAAPAASFSAEQLATLAWHSAVSNLFESPSDLIEDLARAKQKR